MNTQDLIEIEERLEELPDDPWWWERSYEIGRDKHWAMYNAESKAQGEVLDFHHILRSTHEEHLGTPVDETPIVSFIADAPTIIRKLLDEVHRLRDRQNVGKKVAD